MLEFYVEVHDEVSCIFFLCLPLPLKSSEKGKFQRSLSFARKSSSPQQSLKTSFHFAFGSSIFDLLTQLTLRWAAAGAQRRGDVAALRRPPLRKQTPRKDYWLTFKVVGKLVSTINLFGWGTCLSWDTQVPFFSAQETGEWHIWGSGRFIVGG